MFELLKPDKRKVGNRLRKVKDELGVSFTDFGNRLGLIKPTINSYVRGYSLAPLEVIKKVAKISGKPVGWFYYGEIEEYIYDYLMLKGEELFLKDYPEIPQQIKEEFLNGVFNNPGWENDVGYPHEIFIDDCFYEIYYEKVKKYVFNLTNEFFTQSPMTASLDEKEKEDQALIVASQVYSYINMARDIKYGEENKIKKMIENTYKQSRDLKFDDEYLVGKLINLLGNEKQTENLISLLSQLLTHKHFNTFFGGKELVEIFQSIRPQLIDLYTNTNYDEYYDWFEKE